MEQVRSSGLLLQFHRLCQRTVSISGAVEVWHSQLDFVVPVAFKHVQTVAGRLICGNGPKHDIKGMNVTFLRMWTFGTSL